MFIGRERETAQLQDFMKRKIAGLVVCSGRRRIGKSTLIEYVGKAHNFLEFYGLAPREGITNWNQLEHFGEQMGAAFDMPPFKFDSWFAAFSSLAEMATRISGRKKIVIFLDEISWMANKKEDFVGVLKGIWDTKFKKNDRLVLILCGSVSSWIEKNILNDKGFMGRISLTINLQEMPLNDANKFWESHSFISAYEKNKVLCVTGGVPRYLEEVRPSETAEQNLKRLCFTSEGVLFGEFDKIFNDTFGKQAAEYKRMIEVLADGSLDMYSLCKRLGVPQSGNISNKLLVLEQSGFISRDYVWNHGERRKNLSKYRLKDNYIRFYLKYIEPKKELIREGLYKDLDLESLPEWATIMGFQFENLILNNLPLIQKILRIPPASMLSASPYFQKATLRKRGCQIDLLIETRHTLYVCEIKSAKKIGKGIIVEMKQKIESLEFPKTTSVRPVLIYQGELSDSVVQEYFFSDLIAFEDLLTAS